MSKKPKWKFKDEHFIDVIRIWFIRRFGRLPSQDAGYFGKWVERFQKRYAIASMDSYSYSLWVEIEKEFGVKYSDKP